MSNASDIFDGLNNYFNAYKQTSEYKDRSMLELSLRKKEFEDHLDDMWSIYLQGNPRQLVEYRKQVDDIKSSGYKVLRNSEGKHKLVLKGE